MPCKAGGAWQVGAAGLPHAGRGVGGREGAAGGAREPGGRGLRAQLV